MASLTVIQPNHLTGFGGAGGNSCVVGATTAGDNFNNFGGSVLFYVLNCGPNNQTVNFLFNANSTIDGQVPPNPNGTIRANNAWQIFGPFNSTWYADANDVMYVNYSNGSNLSVMPFLMGD